MNVMKSQSEFEKILFDKMNPNLEPSNAHQQSTFSSEQTDYVHLAYLMGQMGRRQKPLPKTSQVYKNTAASSHESMLHSKNKSPQNGQKTSAPRVLRKSHNFTPGQLTAYQTLRLYNESLVVDFTESELKSTFRKLALKFHPDTTIYKNSEANYIEIKKAFDILKDLFVTKTVTESQNAA